MSLENWDNAELNKRLLTSVETAIGRCLKAYGDKAKTFAVVLNDLEMLALQLQTKMHLEKKANPQLSDEKKSDQQKTDLYAEKKLVFIRLFHREMSTLLSPRTSKAWIKPLLESIKTAEKHGMAIYEHEEDVKKSIKGDSYAYATLAIDEKQNITSKRPTKVDPILNCPLLVIADVSLENLVKLTYNSVDYYIKEGLLQLPTVREKEE